MLHPRIDVHAHYLPEFYRKEAVAAGYAKPDGMPGLPDWDVRSALDMMDTLNIRTALLSISSPGVHFGDDEAARSLARRVNEVAAEASAEHPTRFGFFASLPLPDVDGALSELAYAFDVLGADGVTLETNHHGIYMGDPKLTSLFAELNRRRSIIFLHPTSPHCPCCQGLGYPRPMLEFMFETTRAVTNLILSGTLDRFPELRVIVPHAGAALPVLADRIVGLAPAIGLPEPVDPEKFFSNLRRLYYDLAGFPLPRLAPALMSIADPQRVMYGSDWPFTPMKIVTAMAGLIGQSDLFDQTEKDDILMNNALRLFPRLILETAS